MKLTIHGIQNREPWEKAGICLPGYDVEAVSERAKKAPVWVHFGIGNIFRVFISGIADGLLEEGVRVGFKRVEVSSNFGQNKATDKDERWFFKCQK